MKMKIYYSHNNPFTGTLTFTTKLRAERMY